MNLTLNNMNGPAAQAKAPAPAAIDAAAPPASPAVDAPGAARVRKAPAAGGAPQTPAQPALAFAQWLGLEQIVPAAAGGVDDTDGAAAVALDGIAPGLETALGAQQPNADTPLLGAMGMPLMPITQAALAAAVAALPGVPVVKQAAPARDTDVASSPDAPVVQRAGAALPAAGSALAAAPGAASNPAPAPPPLAAGTLASSGDAPQEPIAPSIERGAANTVGIAAPAPGNAQRTADTVTLAGPPTAWRQTLQEALGDRLQLQLGKNAEQAVIRLEPPMLGRVEIAIRHSAGSLEVHISATHGEVLRQLQAVGENLRNDLAQRQFTDVAVNIAQAPRGAAAGNMNTFAGDGNGRGRQQDGAQEEQTPGNALAEADTGASPFSLNVPGNRRA
ncbi:MAG: hypothetical protein JWQ80_2994 [Massilia sp.]|nr:hypothetical protein [Massilia sp.]